MGVRNETKWYQRDYVAPVLFTSIVLTIGAVCLWFISQQVQEEREYNKKYIEWCLAQGMKPTYDLRKQPTECK